ncbi:MAG: SusE domain-containing protein [Flavisolibacter sp.]
MRSLRNIIFLAAGMGFLLAACNKVKDLPYYGKGSAVTLTASKQAVVPTPADSANNVLSFTWTDPKYATDTSNYKFILELDSTGRNFSREATKEVLGKKTVSFTGRELNTILVNYGFALGTPVVLDFRVTSSYANNNEKYTSNVVKVSVTPYSDPSVLTSENTAVTGTAGTSTAHSNTFSWTPSFQGYTGVITYTLQYDSAGKNFTAPQEIAVGNDLYSKSLTQDDMNTTALTSGIAIGSTGKVEYRIKGTTAAGAIAYSSPVNVSVTTFSPVPANLYIVGDATPGGWNNPVPTPSQQFTKVDAYSFSLTLWLDAGKSYLFLPLNGSWDHKFGGATDGTATGGGTLLKDGAVPGSNTPAPATSGIYKIVVNFQTNTYTVTPVAVPANLYIVGDATPGGWNNPVPIPSQQFTKIDAVSYGIVINLTAGKSYLFLPANGDWSHKYGGATDGTATGGGTLLADGAVPGSNTPAPGASGLYKIIVNFATNSYTVTPYDGPSNLYIVGDATAGGWNNPVPVPSQQFTQVGNAEFQLTTQLTAGKSYLLLPVNGDWGHKYGGATDGTAAGGGILLKDGDVPGSNTPAPGTTGNYLIDVNFITMTYKVTPQ